MTPGSDVARTSESETTTDKGPTFLLTDVLFDGMTAVDPAIFRPLYDDLLNTQVSLFDLEVLTRQVTAVYRNQGFILSRVVLPRQDVSDGHITLRAVEGYVGEVVINGIDDPPQRLVTMADRLTGARPLDARTLERYTLLINDLPGVEAKAVFSPMANQLGAAQIQLDTDIDRFDLTLSADNRGTKFNGPYQFRAMAGINSLVQPFDRATFRAITTDSTEELQLFAVGYDMPIGAEGTRLSLNGLISQQEPGFLLATTQTESDSYRVTTQVTQPFVRSRHFNVRGRLGLSVYHLETQQLGIEVSREDLRSLRAGVTIDWADQCRGVNVLDVEFSQGLNICGYRGTGATNNSRPRGRSDYTKIGAYLSREQFVAPSWSVLVQGSGQYGLTYLLASEEFGFGGIPFGRAHDSSEITGDSGIAGSVELRYTLYPQQRYLRRCQLYNFLDAGKVWRRDTSTRAATADAAGAGLGMRVNFDGKRRASVEFAKPLSQSVASEGADGYDWRVFFSVTAEF